MTNPSLDFSSSKSFSSRFWKLSFEPRFQFRWASLELRKIRNELFVKRKQRACKKGCLANWCARLALSSNWAHSSSDFFGKRESCGIPIRIGRKRSTPRSKERQWHGRGREWLVGDNRGHQVRSVANKAPCQYIFCAYSEKKKLVFASRAEGRKPRRVFGHTWFRKDLNIRLVSSHRPVTHATEG